MNQLDLAKQVQTSSLYIKSTESFGIENLTQSFMQFTSNQERLVKQLNHDILKAIDSKLPKPVPLLEALNHVEDPAMAAKIQKRIDFIGKSQAKRLVSLLREAKEAGKNFNSFAVLLEALQYEETYKTGKRRGKKYQKRIVSESKLLEIIDRCND